MSKSFKEWLKTSQYTKIDTVRDDMIRDILQDVTFPDSSDETSLVTYMESRLHKLGRHSLLPNFKAIYASYLIYVDSNH